MADNDPYAKYGGRAAQPGQQASPASDPYARYGGRVAAAPTAQPQSAPDSQGFFSSAADSSGLSAIKWGVTHPLQAAKAAIAPMNPFATEQDMRANPILGAGMGTADEMTQAYHDYKAGNSAGAQYHSIKAIPLIGPIMDKATDQYADKNYRGETGTLLGFGSSMLAPELLKSAPGAVSRTLGKAGDALQDSGANRMDRFLNGGKPLPVGEYNAPGAAVLDAGPGTSVVLKRPSLAPKIAAAKSAAAPAIDAAAANATGRVSIPDIRNAVDSTIAPLKTLATGPGGNPGVAPRLDYLRDSFGPQLNLNGSVSAPGVLKLRRTLDSNINWNRGPDPIDATARNATRQIRGKVNSLLYDAAPEVKAPSQRYGNLADAQQLAEDNANANDVKLGGGLSRFGADVIVGGGVGIAAHNPAIALGTAAATHVAPMLWKTPLTQTGLATGAYQLGKGLSALAPTVSHMTGPMAGAVQRLPTLGSRIALPALAAPSLTPQLPLPTPLQIEGDQRQGPQNQIRQNNHSEQSAPPGATSLRLPMPELRNLAGGVVLGKAQEAVLRSLLLPSGTGLRG